MLEYNGMIRTWLVQQFDCNPKMSVTLHRVEKRQFYVLIYVKAYWPSIVEAYVEDSLDPSEPTARRKHYDAEVINTVKNCTAAA